MTNWNHDITTAPRGIVFPPRDVWDVAAYDADECSAGYREHRIGDKPPGNNRSASYRWGWANARRDRVREDDGFDGFRSEFIHMERQSRLDAAATEAINNLGLVAD